jgi:D-alanyl-D-alanine carboxypeptidase/D-alanyl-D-alanine-endopeptidase (penicillin-binding protein 4)
MALFKDALARHGITVSGNLRTAHWTDREVDPLDFSKWHEIGFIQSRPFRDIIRSVEKPSQNLYTDLILEHIGAREGGATTSEQSGVHALNQFLAHAGISRTNYYFEEGSGLSRDNLVSPNATVALLTYMSHHKDFGIYYDALPIAGVDGTLQNRMNKTAAARNVHAKTGTLRWANSMSGYVTSAAGEHLVFSLMLNRFQDFDRDHSKTQGLDAIAEMLAGFKARADK